METDPLDRLILLWGRGIKEPSDYSGRKKVRGGRVRGEPVIIVFIINPGADVSRIRRDNGSWDHNHLSQCSIVKARLTSVCSTVVVCTVRTTTAEKTNL